MTASDLEKKSLAAGYVTSTLSEEEFAEAKALLMSDPDFAALVVTFQEKLEAEEGGVLPERVWEAIEKRLTGKPH